MEDRLAEHRDKDGSIIMHQKWCNAILKNQKWTFAKTMPQWPHWWTHIDSWEYPELIVPVATWIHEHGQKETWDSGRRIHNRIYYYYGGYKYWIMDKNPKDVVLINRAIVEI